VRPVGMGARAGLAYPVAAPEESPTRTDPSTTSAEIRPKVAWHPTEEVLDRLSTVPLSTLASQSADAALHRISRVTNRRSGMSSTPRPFRRVMAMIAQKSLPRTQTLSALSMSWSMERARSSTTAYPLIRPTRNKHGWILWPTIAGHAWPDKPSSSFALGANSRLTDSDVAAPWSLSRDAVEQAVAADVVAAVASCRIAAPAWRRPHR